MSVVKYEIQQKDLIIYYDDFRIKKTIINYTSKDLEIVLL